MFHAGAWKLGAAVKEMFFPVGNPRRGWKANVKWSGIFWTEVGADLSIGYKI